MSGKLNVIIIGCQINFIFKIWTLWHAICISSSFHSLPKVFIHSLTKNGRYFWKIIQPIILQCQLYSNLLLFLEKNISFSVPCSAPVANALCSYPLVNMEIGDSIQIPTTAPIFFAVQLFQTEIFGDRQLLRFTFDLYLGTSWPLCTVNCSNKNCQRISCNLSILQAGCE